MSLWKIAWRSVQQRKLSSVLTCLSMALGVALVITVLVGQAIVDRSFNKRAGLGFHMVVGGKNGSKLELVLSTVYYLRWADEPMPYRYYKKFITPDKDGGFGDSVERAVPICLGDTYEGYRVVGTTPEMFDFEYSTGRRYEFAQGEVFQKGDFFDGVIGAEVARRTGLKIGDTFQPTHGAEGAGGEVHEDRFKVAGILARSGTPNDRALFINIEGFYLIGGHQKISPPDEQQPAADKEAAVPHANPAGLKPLPENQREVTAIFVLAKNDFYARVLDNLINEGSEAQSVSPVRVIASMLDEFVGPIGKLLLGLTILTVLVASIGVMVGIYNTMIGRKHEIAVMRALGASRRTVMIVILLESILLSLGGGLAGMVLGHGLIAASTPLMTNYTGVVVSPLQFELVEVVLIPALVVLASIVGFVPAMTAYRTDVAKSLTAMPQ